MIEHIKNLEKCVPLSVLVDQGIVEEEVLRDLNIFKTWDALVKQGKQKMRAYRIVARESGVCLMTVQRAVKRMKGNE